MTPKNQNLKNDESDNQALIQHYISLRNFGASEEVIEDYKNELRTEPTAERIMSLIEMYDQMQSAITEVFCEELGEE